AMRLVSAWRRAISRTRAVRRRAVLGLLGMLALAALFVPTGVRSGPVPPSIFEQKLYVRLEGYLDAPTEKVHPWRPLTVRLVGTPGENRQFALTNIIVLSGNGSGFGLIEQLMVTKPNLFIAGDRHAIDGLASAPPDQFLRIRGSISFGSRWFVLDQ